MTRHEDWTRRDHAASRIWKARFYGRAPAARRRVRGVCTTSSTRLQLLGEDFGRELAADPPPGVDRALEMCAGPDARIGELVGQRRGARPLTSLLGAAVRHRDGTVETEQARQLDFEKTRADRPRRRVLGLGGAGTSGCHAASRGLANSPAIAVSGRQRR